MSYVKLFASTMHSSIWMEPDHVLKVWITMLLMADRDGVVEAAVPGLARAAGKTIPETEEALQRFLTPDQYSRTPDNEGRRIEPIAGGWRLLNYEIYRDKQSLEERREKDAARQRRKREREAKAKRDSVDSHSMSRDDVPEKRDVSRPVTGGHACHDIISSHNNSEEKSKSKSLSAEADDSESKPVKREPSRFAEFWAVYPRNEGKKLAGEVWRAKKLDRIADQLIADVKARVERHRQWIDGFAPHASKYLRQELWQDEISSTKPNGARPPRTSTREAPMLQRLDLGTPR